MDTLKCLADYWNNLESGASKIAIIALIVGIIGLIPILLMLFKRSKTPSDIDNELDNFDKIISDLSTDNDATKMNSITKLISMIESDKANIEIATQISKIVSANIKEAIKKLLVIPNRRATDGSDYPIPNRLTDAEIEGMRLLSLIYDKFQIRANFKAVDVTRLDFTKVELNGADFTGAIFSNSHFEESSLKNAIFFNASICGANFRLCHLEESDFRVKQSDAKNSFGGAHFEGANMSTISSKFTRLEGAYVDNTTILPNPFSPYHIINEKNIIERNENYNRGKYSD